MLTADCIEAPLRGVVLPLGYVGERSECVKARHGARERLEPIRCQYV